MIPSRIATGFLAAATLFAPSLVRAQMPTAETQSTPNQLQQQRQQQQPGTNQSAMNETQDAAPNSGASGQMMKDKIFLRKAAEGGMAEVKLGQLASQKADSQNVKDFGAKMVTDHTELNNEMKPIADSLGVMLPKKLNAKDQAEFDKLNGLSGNDFDTEYVTFMVKDHHEDLREFRMEAANTTDPALKAAVDKGAKVIREHLSMVTALAKEKGIDVPARGPRQAAPAVQ